jgi:UDP-GlcNAc3NAcA epimerase
MELKFLTILGARPQFVKAAAVSRAVCNHNENNQTKIREVILHTGQHFDANMSDVFFDQMGIPKPDYQLSINGLSHGAMTGRMLEGIEKIIHAERPDCVLVYGDTNSTLAGALAATKLHLPIAHVEAGLRSHNLAMPEEVNRVITDRVSKYLFCPTTNAVENLVKEGFPFRHNDKKLQIIENIGDVMFDVVLHYQEKARKAISLDLFGISDNNYVLCTLHRQENTDDPMRLDGILKSLKEINMECQVVLPLHPRTKKLIQAFDKLDFLADFVILDPLPYLEMQRLQMGAKIIMTDSGGMQKEAFFHQVPCVTLRDETEWLETVKVGWNQVAGSTREGILAAWNHFSKKWEKPIWNQGNNPYGNGNAAIGILGKLSSEFGISSERSS